MTILYIAAALGLSFLFVYAAVPTIITISKEKKLFDMPDERKLNKIAIPTIGGIAIFGGWIISSLLCLQENFVHGMQYLLVTMLLMFFVGLKDDIIVIVAWKKFAIQVCAAIVLVTLGDFGIINLSGLLGITALEWWFSIPLSVLFILFLTNALNLIDGIDGLASGLSILSSVVLGVWFYFIGSPGYATVCFALAGSLAAFILFNLSNGKNKTFMGDTGSLVIGIFFSAIVIYFLNTSHLANKSVAFLYPPVVALALFIVPVTDTLRVFFVRIKNKRSPFEADMNHIHHWLIKGGMTHAQGTCFLIAYTILFMLLALAFSYLEIGVTTSFVMVLSLSFILIACIRRIIQALEKKKGLPPSPEGQLSV